MLPKLNPWLRLEHAADELQDVLRAVGETRGRYLSDRDLTAKAFEGLVHASAAISALRDILNAGEGGGT